MNQPRRILIVRPSALGDVCRTVPILATLRRAWPEAVIDWVVQADFAAAIACHPGLNEVIRFPRREFGRWWRNPSTAVALGRWLADLRRRRYDLVLDCQGLGRSGLFTWLTRAPRRVGHRSARELGWLGCNVRHSCPDALHTVERMMSLLTAEGLEPVFDMRLYAADDDLAWWDRYQDGAQGPYAVLAPTSRWPSKRWPQSNWISLIAPLGERGFKRLVLIGAPSERHQVAKIVGDGTEPAIVDLVGRTDVGRILAVIAGAGLVIANDSAPLHVAVGFSRPCVGLYGPTDPARVGPWGVTDGVVRAKPVHDTTTNFKDRRIGDTLMRLIEPAAVLDSVDRVLPEDDRVPPTPVGQGRCR
jgi:lipopolysaccharide heptosyltransferase I